MCEVCEEGGGRLHLPTDLTSKKAAHDHDSSVPGGEGGGGGWKGGTPTFG